MITLYSLSQSYVRSGFIAMVDGCLWRSGSNGSYWGRLALSDEYTSGYLVIDQNSLGHYQNGRHYAFPG